MSRTVAEVATSSAGVARTISGVAQVAAATAGSATTTQAAAASAPSASLDPRFPTCKAAIAAGYGPYRVGLDPEYHWYKDADHDGIDCER